MRWVKLFIAILLLPACAAATLTAVQIGHALIAGSQTSSAVAFGVGYTLWLVVFAFLPKPIDLDEFWLAVVKAARQESRTAACSGMAAL